MESRSNGSFGLDTVTAIDTHERPFQTYTVPTMLCIQMLMTILHGRYDFLNIVHKEPEQRLNKFPTFV